MLRINSLVIASLVSMTAYATHIGQGFLVVVCEARIIRAERPIPLPRALFF